jgi:C4-dicarboxylate-specific signal transduction histidine kinase
VRRRLLAGRGDEWSFEPMKPTRRLPSIAKSTALPAVTFLLAIAIFALDTVTNREIAVAVLYVAVVLLSVGFCRKQGVVLVSLGCMGLTILSFMLTRNGLYSAGLINCSISLLAIAATTFLALRIESAELAAHEARAELAHIARVTMLGELTASIAHEVNQPLAATVINGNACLRWLAARPPNLEEATAAVERIVQDATRAGNVIARVRALFKKAAPRNEYVNINEIIKETVALIGNEFDKNHVSLKMQLPDGLPLIVGDHIQLQQVVLNLVLNAIEAMTDNDASSRELLVSTSHDDSSGVLVALRDTGQGLDPAKIDAVFDAFYTTKRQGLGMGLAISRSIVEACGGRIWAKPNTPRGAVFQFLLPTGTAKAT